MAFDDTYTDRDFKRRLREAEEQWIGQIVSDEPDLRVDGMQRTFFTRLLALFSTRSR